MKMKLIDYRTNLYLLVLIFACMRIAFCFETEDKKFFNSNTNVKNYFFSFKQINLK